MTKLYTLGLYEKSMPGQLSWKAKLEAAQRSGFDFVEISIDETDEKQQRLAMTGAERFELVKLMSGIGLPIRTMCLSGHRKYPLGSSDQEIRSRSLEIMQKAIGFSEDLGIRIIQLAGYDVYYEPSTDETRKWFLENLIKSAEMAAKAGIVLGFETMETEFMNTVEKAMHYVRQVNSMYLGVYPDIGNITNAAKTYGTDVREDLRAGRGHLTALHLKETVPDVFREVPFGTGHVDFEAAVRTAWELGVRKYVTEFWYTGNPDWETDLIFAQRMMGRILNQESAVF